MPANLISRGNRELLLLLLFLSLKEQDMILITGEILIYTREGKMLKALVLSILSLLMSEMNCLKRMQSFCQKGNQLAYIVHL
jgi:hypothetical protein